MKNKRNTYLLLAVVIAIWGIIIYRMADSLSPDRPITGPETEHTEFKPQPLKTQDTFSISVHRRDPFLGVFETAAKNKPARKTRALPAKKEELKISVRFSGMIAGKNAKEHVYFVSINDQQHLMKLNDEVQQVKLVKGTAKSIRIKYHDQLRTIPLSQ